VTESTPSRIYIATLAFAAWLSDHEDLGSLLEHVGLADAEQNGGYHVHLTVYGHARDTMQAVVDQLATAIDCETNSGYATSATAHSTWQWSLRADREYMGMTLRWAATIVCRRPSEDVSEGEANRDG
jgi:hypothetical protein